jgi:hypothetical protein
MICYINVRHAGTAFVVHKLLAGMRVTELFSVPDPLQWDVGWSHIEENKYDKIRALLPLATGAFTTFRTGIDQSCAKRQENVWVLGREKQLMFDLMCEFDFLPLHLEIPGRRDEELTEINHRFSLALSSDWARVPSLAAGFKGVA